MADLKTKKILAGVSILLIVVVLFIFRLSSGSLLTNVPDDSEKSTEVAAEQAETHTPLAASTATKTPPAITETPSPIPTITPTFAILTGRVNVDRLNCSYGPGPYIDRADLFRNNHITVIGRDVTSQWLYVGFESNTGEAIKCWVEAKPIDLGGAAISSLENYYPGKYQLPLWKDYKSPENVRISRTDNFVSIVWDDPNLLDLSERENGRSPQFIVEAWVCREGALEFTVLGIVDTTNLIVEDQPGCSEPSSGLLYSAGKHGYSAPVTLAWPAP